MSLYLDALNLFLEKFKLSRGASAKDLDPALDQELNEAYKAGEGLQRTRVLFYATR